MICPHIINVSLLAGGILSWGLMWPLIDTRKGDWFPADIPESNLQGLQGYKVHAFMLSLVEFSYKKLHILKQEINLRYSLLLP